MKFRNVCLACYCIVGVGACTMAPVSQYPSSPDGEEERSSATAETGDSPAADTANPTAGVNNTTPSTAGDDDDLWLRIQRNLSLDRQLDQRAVNDKIDWYRNKPAFLERVADRAVPYLYHIVDRLEQRGMPADLALLPIVESAYKPLAYSRSHASGLWQIIPATATRLGLKQNWWYDGRRDVVAATDAALDYLELLHRQFHGDWYHALASYNAGEARVARAIKRNKAAGKPTDFWSLALPYETRGYVPSLLALTEIFAHPGKYGLTLKPIANEPYFAAINTNRQIDLVAAARRCGLSVDQMYALNPGFNHWATAPEGPHRVLVPVAKADRCQRARTELAVDARIAWKRHQIKKGDSLGRIARHYNTSIDALKRLNQLRDNTIYAGRALLVPAATEPLRHDAAGTERGGGHTYTVRQGDSLWHLSKTYGVSVDQIARRNGIASSGLLQPGQKLLIPGANGDGATLAGGLIPASLSAHYGFESRGYTVKKGDSLWLIARRFKVSVADLKKWNRLSSQGYLQPGQKLVVKIDGV